MQWFNRLQTPMTWMLAATMAVSVCASVEIAFAKKVTNTKMDMAS